MNFPASIKVGFRDYRIESWPAREASASNRFGECDRTNSVIRVRDDLPPQVTAMLAMHEMLHAAWENGDLPGTDEEKTVAVLANQLAQIVRDNPDFMAVIGRLLRGE